VAYDAMDRRGDEVGLSSDGAAKNTLVLESGKEAIRIARAAGCAIGWGSDLMGDLEDEQLAGLRLQAEVEGIERTIEAATATNAEAIQRPDLGKIQVGLAGDLLILDGDVLADPTLLWDAAKARVVIQGGKVVRKQNP
jgi:imidazolonepropionase-like amidohydrolase